MNFREYLNEDSAQDLRMEMFKFLKKKFKKTYRYTSEEFKEEEQIPYNKELTLYVDHKNRLFNYEYK